MAKQKNRWRVIRHELAKAQGFKCCYCKRTFGKKGRRIGATIEHLVARADGGSNRRENLAAACLHCNQHRGQQKQQSAQQRH